MGTFWRTNRFKLYLDGPWWKPPILPFIQHGMPDSDEDDFDVREAAENKPGFAPIGSNAVSQFDDEPRAGFGAVKEPEIAVKSDWEPRSDSKDNYESDKSSSMSSVYRNEFDSALNTVTPVRDLVGDQMALCIDQVDHAQEITDAILEAVLVDECTLDQRLGRIFLISDILYNGSAAPKASRDRNLFDQHLEKIFEKLHVVQKEIKTAFVADQFKNRIKTLFQAWTAWSLFTNETLIKLHNIFNGIEDEKDESNGTSDSDVDGKEIDEKRARVSSDGQEQDDSSDEDEVDGVPLDGVPLEQASSASEPLKTGKAAPNSNPSQSAKPAGVGSGFVASKWEVVDDDDVKNEAVTSAEIFADTKKMEQEKKRNEDYEDKKEAKPEYLQSDAWRKAIRDIEDKVMEYCEQLKVLDDSVQAEAYRSGLITKLSEKFKDDPSIWEDSPRSSPTAKKSKKERRDGEKQKRKKRSRSRDRRKRSRSRSRERRRKRR